MKPRRLTVGYCLESRTTLPDSRRHAVRPPEAMPFLRLRGRWMQEAGFAVGAPVRVVVCEGLLVLEVVKDPAPPESFNEDGGDRC